MRKLLATAILIMTCLWISAVPKTTAEASCSGLGRVVTILLVLSQPGNRPGEEWQPGAIDYMDELLDNTVIWTGKGLPDMKVLVIRDDNHSGEWSGDTDNIYNALLTLGYDTTLLEEPVDGVDYSALVGYDVVFLSNPGYPVDDLNTVQALQEFFDEGGGVIIQGDDVAQGAGNIESLIRLHFLDNGTSYYGYYTDNMSGEFYHVEMIGDAHPVIAGLEGVSFKYGDDIDTCEPANAGELVLAWATIADAVPPVPSKPVITAYESPVTIDGLISCKEKCFIDEGIDNRGVANSLDQKLEAAKAALDRGQSTTAVNILNAFMNEVEAQSGKHISSRCAHL